MTNHLSHVVETAPATPRRGSTPQAPELLEYVVIGGGFAGLHSALRLADSGIHVIVLEQSRELMRGASRNNMARVHHGWHYSGSLATALDECIPAAFDFLEEYSDILHTAGRGTHAPFRTGWCVLTSGGFTQASEWLEAAELMRERYSEELSGRRVTFGPVADFFRILPKKTWGHRLNPQRVILAAATLEPFIDLEALSRKVVAAVYAHPRVSVRTGHEVVSAGPASPGESDNIALTVRIDGARHDELWARHVLNASWSTRAALEADFARRVGKAHPPCVTHRLRAFLRVRLPAELRDLPSMVFVHGPFVTFTNCGDGTGMVAYEPASNLASAVGGVPEDWNAILRGAMPAADQATLSRAILTGSDGFVPGLAECEVLEVSPATSYHYGNTDIYDPQAAIHHRLGTGIRSVSTNWLSMDTGKLSWVPRHARQLGAVCQTV